jgi:hypothetical protein
MRATSLTFNCIACGHSATFAVRQVEEWLDIPPYEALITSDIEKLRRRLVCTTCSSRNVAIATNEPPSPGQGTAAAHAPAGIAGAKPPGKKPPSSQTRAPSASKPRESPTKPAAQRPGARAKQPATRRRQHGLRVAPSEKKFDWNDGIGHRKHGPAPGLPPVTPDPSPERRKCIVCGYPIPTAEARNPSVSTCSRCVGR